MLKEKINKLLKKSFDYDMISPDNVLELNDIYLLSGYVISPHCSGKIVDSQFIASQIENLKKFERILNKQHLNTQDQATKGKLDQMLYELKLLEKNIENFYQHRRPVD